MEKLARILFIKGDRVRGMQAKEKGSQKDHSMILLLANTLMWSVMGAYMPFIHSFYSVRGLSTLEIGALTAITPVLAILIQPFWAYLSDFTGRRKVVLISIVLASGLVIQGYRFCHVFFLFVAETLMFGTFSTSVLPLSDALVSNHANKSKLGFARIRMGGTIGFAIMALILGNVVKSDVSLIFPIAGLGYLLLALCYLGLPKDAPQKTLRARSKGRVFKDDKVFFVFFLAFLVQFGTSVSGFYGVYVLELGYNQSIMGLSSCISALSELPILFFADKILRRFKINHLMVFAVLMNALRMLLVASGILPLMIGAQVLQSGSYMIPYYCCIVFINENVIDGKISQGQSRLAMVQQGVATVSGSLLGGAISGQIGLKSTFMVVAAVLACVSVISIFIGKRMFDDER